MTQRVIVVRGKKGHTAIFVQKEKLAEAIKALCQIPEVLAMAIVPQETIPTYQPTVEFHSSEPTFLGLLGTRGDFNDTKKRIRIYPRSIARGIAKDKILQQIGRTLFHEIGHYLRARIMPPQEEIFYIRLMKIVDWVGSRGVGVAVSILFLSLLGSSILNTGLSLESLVQGVNSALMHTVVLAGLSWLLLLVAFKCIYSPDKEERAARAFADAMLKSQFASVLENIFTIEPARCCANRKHHS